ncbi:MAG: hypothetical protein ACRD3G_09030 [Vicinamibacterales bacterium]
MPLQLKQIIGRWEAITAVGAAVVATATGIFRAPPVGDAPGLLALGGLLAAVVSGLVYVAMIKYAMRRHLLGWIVAAVVGLAGSLTAYHQYSVLWDSYVAEYQGEQKIVGDELTPDGVAYSKQEQISDPTQLLFAAGGVAEQIWTSASIARVRAIMRLTYYLSFPLVAISILATVQAVYCATRRESRSKVVSSVA